MSKIEKLQRYIDRTGISPELRAAYGMYSDDMYALYKEMNRDWFCAMVLIFTYGQAKGYRAAKAEMCRE